jgi:hypothetical protein
MVDDPRASEKFVRVVGHRTTAPEGQLPPRASREAMATMARYLTRAPKGVFIYASHEEANQDRERWIVDAMVAVHEHG